MYDYDDYLESMEYCEPSVFAGIMNEAIEKIKESAKYEVKSHFEKILEENESLKEHNKKLKEKENAVESLKRELEREKQKLEINFYRTKFSEICKDLIEEGWEVNSKYIKDSKCALCNDSRQLEYTSIQGKKNLGPCECNKGKYKYYPSKIKLVEIEIGKSISNGAVWKHLKYVSHKDDDRYLTLEFSRFNQIFEEIPNLSEYGAYYLSKEECKKHCDYLNNAEEK